jgi:tRNA-specific adenosine deaminase 3
MLTCPRRMLRELKTEDIVKGMPHLRRCAKPTDLPTHLKTQFMNESTQCKQLHTARSTWVYVMLGLEDDLVREEIVKELKQIEGMEETDLFIASIPVPFDPPSSQVQAALWTNMFWPTVYRKTNPLGPHPSLVSRTTDEIANDAAAFMSIAQRVADNSKAAGFGEAMGACIAQRDEKTGAARLVAVAADARWQDQYKKCGTGNPMAHAVLRAISMVAQKLVRAEGRNEDGKNLPILEFEAFQDRPLLEEEAKVFTEDHPSPDGYLCHGLELYLTHEPCVMCSMAILHSRMGKVIFSHRMPLTGGLGAEARLTGRRDLDELGGGRGIGLFWRRELNWSLLAWEWEPTDSYRPLAISPLVHA